MLWAHFSPWFCLYSVGCSSVDCELHLKLINNSSARHIPPRDVNTVLTSIQTTQWTAICVVGLMVNAVVASLGSVAVLGVLKMTVLQRAAGMAFAIMLISVLNMQRPPNERRTPMAQEGNM